MGYALFTARKLSLQQKINQYNLQLMKLTDREEQLTQQTSANSMKKMLRQYALNQQMTEASSASAVGMYLGKEMGSGTGDIISFASMLLGTGMTEGQKFEQMMNSIQDQKDANDLSLQSGYIDEEKKRINTLLTAAQNELQQVEKAEESAIKASTPKYTA